MKTEVFAAAHFLTGLIRLVGIVTEDHLHRFHFYLIKAMLEYYHNHWYPQEPCRGSGYRCLRINHRMDPVISKAGLATGFTEKQLLSLLPAELTVWVDPNYVSYRIGENGSICELYRPFSTCTSTSVTVREANSKQLRKD